MMLMLTARDVDSLHLRPRRPDETGGEWDVVRNWPPKVLRRLRGAGFIGRRGGLAPDQLAWELYDRLGDVSIDDALEAWKKAVLELLVQRRRANRAHRELKLAKRAGYPTWHAYRTALYRDRLDDGSITEHHYCKERGWR